MRPLTALLALTLAGCSGATVLMHPTTGHIRECETSACVDEHLRTGYACVYNDCWTPAPAGAGTVFVQRTPPPGTPTAAPAPPRRTLAECQHLPVTEIRACMGVPAN